jgi:hypothetical protein
MISKFKSLKDLDTQLEALEHFVFGALDVSRLLTLSRITL